MLRRYSLKGSLQVENMGKKKKEQPKFGLHMLWALLSQVQPAVDVEPVGEEASLYWTFSCRDLPLVNLGILGVLKPFPHGY